MTDSTETPKVMAKNQQTGEMMEIPAPKKSKVPMQFCRWCWTWQPADKFFPYLKTREKSCESKRSALAHKQLRERRKAAAITIDGSRSEAVMVMTDTILTPPTKKNGKGKVAVKPDPTVMGKAPQNAKKMTPKVAKVTTPAGHKVDPAIIAKARANAAKKVASK